MVSLTETSNKIGSILFTAGCGILSYYAYPDVSFLFYLLGAGGLVATLFILSIPDEAIEDERARASNTKIEDELIQDAAAQLSTGDRREDLANQSRASRRSVRDDVRSSIKVVQEKHSRYRDLLQDRNVAMFLQRWGSSIAGPANCTGGHQDGACIYQWFDVHNLHCSGPRFIHHRKDLQKVRLQEYTDAWSRHPTSALPQSCTLCDVLAESVRARGDSDLGRSWLGHLRYSASLDCQGPSRRKRSIRLHIRLHCDLLANGARLASSSERQS